MNINEKNNLSTNKLEKAVNNLLISMQDSNQGRLKRYELKGNYNNVVTAVAQISEISGGSCWSEESHYETETSYKEIKPVLKNQFNRALNPFFESIGISTQVLDIYLDQFLDENKKYDKIGEHTDYEYYGNSTTYGVYGLNLDNLIGETCSEEVQRIYYKQLNQISLQNQQVVTPKIKM